jgi:hypothetical protein
MCINCAATLDKKSRVCNRTCGGFYINYTDTNVAYEIPPLSDADGDGNREECFEDVNVVKLWGDNHVARQFQRLEVYFCLFFDGYAYCQM